ncbi:hypothetical protein [Qipengyuania sp. ASV99]|uniref:hypothetical protein n=1 Tax=Qipengyuania sp. ASV99 TaxID=3399681 RepID=UPI003A4C7394
MNAKGERPAKRKLTKTGQSDTMQFRAAFVMCLAPALCALAACSGNNDDVPAEAAVQDPLLSRALNDPLMVDPDLAWRNEANAVIALRDGHPLPPVQASDDMANRAREAMRSELVENGQIPPLPAASAGKGSPSLAGLNTAAEIVEAVGSRTDCIAAMDGDLQWSANLPPTSAIMPHGMVQQAAGVDQGNCVIRVVRYLTPVGVDEALEYHFTKADRERFRIERFAAPESSLRAERRDQQLAVHVRKAAGGMTAVDVVHWRK